MRKLGKILRWIFMVIGVIEIVGNLLTLFGNGERSQGEAIGVTIFWVVVVAVLVYFERRSNIKPKQVS